MALRFSCVCGNPLVSLAHQTGQRVRCPLCGESVVVADSGDWQPVNGGPTIKPLHPNPVETAITFRCACGNPLQVRAERKGSRAKCPGCGATVTIPPTSQSPPVDGEPNNTNGSWIARPAVTAARSADRYDDEETGNARKRGDPGRARRLPLALSLVVLVMVLGVAAAGVTYLFRSPRQTREVSGDQERMHADMPLARGSQPAMTFPGPRPSSMSMPGQASDGPAAGMLMGARGMTGPPPSISLAAGNPAEADALIPATVFGFVSVPVAAWWKGHVGQGLQALSPTTLARLEIIAGTGVADVERVIVVFPEPLLQSRWVMVVTAEPYNPLDLLAKNGWPSGTPLTKLMQNNKEIYVVRREVAFYFHNDRILVTGTEASVKHFVQNLRELADKAAGAHELSPANQNRLVAVAAPTPEQLEVVMKLLPDVVLPFGGLLDVRRATLTAQLDGDLTVDLSLFYRDEMQAGTAAAVAPLARDWGRDLLRRYKDRLIPDGFVNSRKSIELLDEPLSRLVVDHTGADVKARFQLKNGTAALVRGLLLPAVERSRREYLRWESARKLSILASAMREYQEAYRRLPPAKKSKPGGPPVSWRVELLPFLGMSHLYGEYDHELAWDHPNNLKLLAKMPRWFEPVVGSPGKDSVTHFQVFVGPDAPFDGERRMSTDEFVDGTGNTILIVEAKEPVPWTKPDDLPFTRDGPLPRLGGQVYGGFHAVMANCRVRFIPHTIPDKTLRALITPTGGEAVDWNW